MQNSFSHIKKKYCGAAFYFSILRKYFLRKVGGFRSHLTTFGPRPHHPCPDTQQFSEEKACFALMKKTTFSSEKCHFSLGKRLFLH
jgi:hypothetical protein